MIRKFKGIFELPSARFTDQWCRSELRQAGFSCDFCYPLVHTVRNAAQIANKIPARFKTEFFNTIGRKADIKKRRKYEIRTSTIGQEHAFDGQENPGAVPGL